MGPEEGETKGWMEAYQTARSSKEGLGSLRQRWAPQGPVSPKIGLSSISAGYGHWSGEIKGRREWPQMQEGF